MSSGKWPCLWLREWLPALGGTVPSVCPTKPHHTGSSPSPRPRRAPRHPKAVCVPARHRAQGGPLRIPGGRRSMTGCSWGPATPTACPLSHAPIPRGPHEALPISVASACLQIRFLFSPEDSAVWGKGVRPRCLLGTQSLPPRLANCARAVCTGRGVGCSGSLPVSAAAAAAWRVASVWRPPPGPLCGPPEKRL